MLVFPYSLPCRSPHSVKYPKLPGQLCMSRCPGTARLQMHKMPRYGSRRWKDKPGAEPIGWGLKLECRSDPALVKRRCRDGDDRRARNVSEATNTGKLGKVGVLSITRQSAFSISTILYHSCIADADNFRAVHLLAKSHISTRTASPSGHDTPCSISKLCSQFAFPITPSHWSGTLNFLASQAVDSQNKR